MIKKKFRLNRVDSDDPSTWAMIVQLDGACFNGYAPAVTDNEGQWWIAKCGGEVAGYCAIRQAVSAQDGSYMSRAGVLPRFRGHGLQKQMIRTRVAYAREHGWSYIHTDTYDNPASGNSLIACGFRLVTPPYKWSFDSACYWRKDIIPTTKKATEAPTEIPEKK